MKKLFVLAILAFAVWYGWKFGPQAFQRRPSHDAVVRNRAGMEMSRVRLTVDGQTFVKEQIADGGEAAFPFRVARDATFQLDWLWTDRQGDQRWSGGMVPKGPMVQRHTMTVDGDGGVVYQAEVK